MRHLKIKYKMAVLIAVIVVLLIGIGATGIMTTDRMAERSEETYNQNLQPIYLITEIRGNNRAIESFLLENLITRDAAKSQELKAAIKSNIDTNNELLAELKTIEFSNDKIASNVNEYLLLLPDYRSQRDNIIHLADNNLNDEGYQVFSGKTFSEMRSTMVSLLEDTAALFVEDASAHNAETVRSARSSVTLSGILITAAWILSILISIVITRLITKPLKELQGLMKRAEAGDLTAAASYQSRDEIGQISTSYNTMLIGLKNMMRGVSESAEILSASSEEMSASADQTAHASQLIAETSSEIAAGFDVQAESIALTAQSVRTMTYDIAEAKHSGNEMTGLMEQAAASTDRGASAVEQILTQMREIDSSVAASRNIVSSLGGLSEEINTIITTINEIAAQTNLLSLNASIEAARAGEHGRGFAVVAGEIRKLAEATGRSSLQVTEIINHIRLQTASAVDSMEQGSGIVSRGVAQSEVVSAAFTEIQTSIHAASEQMELITEVIGHVAQESEGVAQAMARVDEISRKGAGDVQDTSAASEEQLTAMGEMSSSAQYLATLAEDLQKHLARFKL
ncbi:methyl-accepting chemotaxis protein [Paenibacillus sp. MMS20-IR301]|uniref:methyl-accepting chemotaxis protein n=1 Tax=Paenibacillus sp. MMS20-IR301 TaxID=2895946 RepID=UPI0028E2ED4F|nr:methyl-accepting chemotaxis protein [Paenibacillus sp. MMS20-IR301]WNS41326.1 methyl-accepting chemotaxis protein [Paenibacillus sp. MMS20-IR301]